VPQLFLGAGVEESPRYVARFLVAAEGDLHIVDVAVHIAVRASIRLGLGEFGVIVGALELCGQRPVLGAASLNLD